MIGKPKYKVGDRVAFKIKDEGREFLINGEVFIEHMTEIKESIYNEALKKDFDALIWNMEQAIETHDVEYMYQIYRIFHDMDYFLLRYGITAMAGYVSDYSTVAKYYGVLEVYKNSENDEA